MLLLAPTMTMLLCRPLYRPYRVQGRTLKGEGNHNRVKCNYDKGRDDRASQGKDDHDRVEGNDR